MQMRTGCSDDAGPPEAARVVEEQRAAYDRHDVEALVSWYAEDARVCAFPGQVRLRGRDQIARAYGALFAANPAVRTSVRGRIVHGPWVVEHEVLHDAPGLPFTSAVVMYRVENGLIHEVHIQP